MTPEEISKLNIYQKINKIMGEFSYVKKTGEIEVTKNSSYSAVLHDHVTMMIQPLFVKYGLVSVPQIVEHEYLRYLVANKYGEKDKYEVRVKVELTVVNSDKPEEKVVVSAVSQGLCNQDKAPGKAYSMAVKYCQLKLLMLASGDQEEERMEESKIIKEEIIKLRVELRDLLKSKERYDEKAEVYIGRLDMGGLNEAIERNKE